MEYERIEKPLSQGAVGSFSPRKLRSMLLGVEKKQPQHEEEAEQEDPGESSAEVFKDVNVVSSVQECKSHHNVGSNATLSRVRSLEEDPSGFEFHKARSAFLSGFAKPAPSKWDDAQKWIASPGSNRVGGRGRRSGRQKVVVEVEVEVEEDLEGRRNIDVSEIKREIGGEEEKGGNWGVDSCGKAMIVAETAGSKQ